MNKSDITFWKTRSMAAFALILLFLTLGSCPVKKVFQFSFFSNAPTEQKAGTEASGRIDVSCTYSEKSVVKAPVQPDRASNPVPPAPEFLIFTALLLLLLPVSLTRAYPVLSPENLQPVPVYLRNRTLLI